MHEVLSSFKWKPIPKFQQQLINFEKPQNFSKTPKPRFENMKCMKNERLEAYQEQKNLEKLVETLRIKIRVTWECLGEKNERAIEREIEENKLRIARGDYIGPQ